MYSMTGYGRFSQSQDGRTLTVELKSVNHRFLDLSLRVPRSLAFAEDKIRKHIASRLTRGHVDVTVTYQNLRSDSKQVTVDAELARAYSEKLEELSQAFNIKDERTNALIASFPEVMTVTEAEEDEKALNALIISTLDAALDRLIKMRLDEGEVMKKDLLRVLDEIEAKSYIIDERYPETVNEYRRKLTDRLTELLSGNVDEARIAQEVAIMADKAAVDEETVRLRSHIKHAREKCESAEPSGRSLDFLVQEMNREVNTVSSKSQDIPITDAVLTCKSAIEKLREQLQNVE